MTNESEYAVTVAVRRPDGSVENVRIGTAQKDGNEFRIKFDDIRISAAPAAGAPAAFVTPQAKSPALQPSAPAQAGMVFPNYGMSKGRPIVGASMRDLEFYANGCRRTLNDPGKARWHDKERILLQAITFRRLRTLFTSAILLNSAR